MPASRACHGCSQASDLSRQGAGQRQSGHLALQWRLDLLLELLHWDLVFKSNDEGPKASTDGRAHQVVKREQHLQLLREGPRRQLAGAKFRHRRCRERASPQLRRVSAAVVGGQSAGSVDKSRFQAVRPIAAAAGSSRSRGARPGKSREECRGVWRGWSGSSRPICCGRSRGG